MLFNILVAIYLSLGIFIAFMLITEHLLNKFPKRFWFFLCGFPVLYTYPHTNPWPTDQWKILRYRGGDLPARRQY